MPGQSHGRACLRSAAVSAAASPAPDATASAAAPATAPVPPATTATGKAAPVRKNPLRDNAKKNLPFLNIENTEFRSII